MQHTRQGPGWWQAWVPLLLLGGLLGLEPQAPLSLGGHQIVQLVIVLLMFGVVLYWLRCNRGALVNKEYEREQARAHMVRQPRREFDVDDYGPGTMRNCPGTAMNTTQTYVGDDNMQAQIRPALVSLGIFTLLTGLLYPLIVTGLAQVLFPGRANGSLIIRNGQAIGSALIGQPFDDPKYVWGRLSATSPTPYTAFNAEKLTGSSGSNYGPRNPALLEAVQGRIKALQDADPANKAPIPVDLVTASGSGLDPHISPAAAAYQVGRVARARGLSAAAVRQVVAQHTEGRTLGLLGEPRVNVLAVNLALDQR